MPIVRPDDGAGTVREPVAGERVVDEGTVREPVAGARVVDDRRGAVVADDGVVARRRFGPGREGALILARIVQLITAVLVIVILAAIALVLLDANAGNSIVSTIHDAGSSLVGPFKDIFVEKDPKLSIAENWGIAAIVYLIVGSVIASLIARIAAPVTTARV